MTSIEQLIAAAAKSYESGDFAAAAQSARLILRQEPNHGSALALLATILVRRARDRGAALDYARRAVEVLPSSPLAQCAMGMAYRDLGLLPQAINHLRNAVQLAPRDREISRQLGMTLVQARSWHEGWQYYEYRPTTPYANGYQKPDPQGITEWGGEDLSGKVLIVFGENGHGDQIQSLRFIPRLLELPVGRLLICVRPALVRLMEHSLAHYAGAERAELSSGERAQDINYQVATDSLAHRFSADEKTLASGIHICLPRHRPMLVPARIKFVWESSGAVKGTS